MEKEMKILVVDDNKDLAKNLKDILEEFGYGTSIAFTGTEAISLCTRQPFDLVLLDYRLPDMDGPELRDRLAEIMDAKYILITGIAPEAWVQKALQSEKLLALETKPLNMGRLLKEIEAVAASRGQGNKSAGDG